MFYDYSRVLSYNAFLNILIGERGVGKTFGATKYVTNKFLKKNEQFAYIRRYKSDLKKSVPKFFDNMIKENIFPNTKFSTKGDKFLINDKESGFSFPLSVAQDFKSSNFPNITTLIFDEFNIEEGQKKMYLRDEVEIFLNLVETIARMRDDIKIFLLGNATNLYTNPYFLYFDLTLPYNNDIKLFKDGLILVQYMKNEEYRQAKRQTKLGKITSGTSFSQYAIDNIPPTQNKDFIERKTGTAKFSFAFSYKGEVYGVWFDFNIGKIFVSKDFDKNTHFFFACTLEDHKPNTMLISSLSNYFCWKQFSKNFQLGNVYYESAKIKYVTLELFKLLNAFK